MNSACKKCGMELVMEEEILGDLVGACINCDIPPQEPAKEVYRRYCWVCKGIVNSSKSKLSSVPIFGFHCNDCGSDLGGWFVERGVITSAEEEKMRDYYAGRLKSFLPISIINRIELFIHGRPYAF